MKFRQHQACIPFIKHRNHIQLNNYMYNFIPSVAIYYHINIYNYESVYDYAYLSLVSKCVSLDLRNMCLEETKFYKIISLDILVCTDLAADREVPEWCTRFVVPDTVGVIEQCPCYVERLFIDIITSNNSSNREVICWCIRDPCPNKRWINQHHFTANVYDTCIRIHSTGYIKWVKTTFPWVETSLCAHFRDSYFLVPLRISVDHDTLLSTKFILGTQRTHT